MGPWRERTGVHGGGGCGRVRGADSCGVAGLDEANQVGPKMGFPERIPMGPAGGVARVSIDHIG